MSISVVGVAGAGTMGAGIAQLACLGRYETVLYDPQPEALERGVERLRSDLGRGVDRDRWSAEDSRAATARLETAAEIGDLGRCELVIEASPESLELKRELFAELEAVCEAETVLATNTSSLPVGEIAAEAGRPKRICGMHFFNPPALMKLVEIVAGERTGPEALAAATEVAERMGRTAIRCTDSPGFIVNRCNRPYTLESLRILEAGIAGHAEIDLILREDGGYPMGPFELIDLIGVDVNLEVARSFYRQRPEPRWQPLPTQEQLVAEGRLGRKAGRGFYDYDAEGERSEPETVPRIDASARRRVLERVVSQLVNEACFAVDEGVAAPDDIDAAMRLGLNHPRGPFEWLAELGARYRAAPRLRRLAA